MGVEIQNENFISQYMTRKHVQLAFGIKTNTEINNLIAEGFLVKYYQYFRPTIKLFLSICPDEIEIKDIGRINGQNRFGFKEIQKIFECNEYIAKTIANLYFIKSQFGYYKRSDTLDKLLAEGETKLKLGVDEDANQEENKKLNT